MSEVPAVPDAPRIHDPVPASAAPLAYAEPQAAAMPAQEIQLSVAEVPSESQSGLSSPAVAEITAALAAPLVAGKAASNSSGLGASVSEVKSGVTDPAMEEAVSVRPDPVGAPRTAGPVTPPSPTLSPQIARRFLAQPQSARLIGEQLHLASPRLWSQLPTSPFFWVDSIDFSAIRDPASLLRRHRRRLSPWHQRRLPRSPIPMVKLRR